MKYGTDYPPRFPFQNSNSYEKKGKEDRKIMSYILQNQMITKCMPSHTQFFLSSTPNVSYFEDDIVAFPPGDFHAIFIGVTEFHIQLSQSFKYFLCQV